MIKLHESDKKFLKAFAKSNEWAILKARLVEPLIREVESVNSEFKFDEGTTNEGKYVGRQLASKFANGLVRIIERYGSMEDKKQKPEDYFE